MADIILEETDQYQLIRRTSDAGYVTFVAWKPGFEPVGEANEQTLRDKAALAIAANKTFLALASPTNAQTLAQVRALTRQMNAVIKIVVGGATLLDTDGT